MKPALIGIAVGKGGGPPEKHGNVAKINMTSAPRGVSIKN